MPIKIKKKSTNSNKPQTLPKSDGNAPPSETISQEHQPFIDKISLVLTPKNDDAAQAYYSSFWQQFKAKQEVFIKTSGHKTVKAKLNLPGVLSLPAIAVELNHEQHRLVTFRIEFNPSKLSEMDWEQLHAYLITFVDDGWEQFVERARITRIDIAVDLPGVRMGDFLFLPKQGASQHRWLRNGTLGSFYHGKSKGSQTFVYSKKKEQLTKHQPFSGESVVRVEHRWKNPSPSLSKELAQLPNPFSKMAVVQIAPPAPQKLNPAKLWQWTLLLDAADRRGLSAALALLPKGQRTFYRKHLAEHPISKWDVEAIWKNWPSYVKTCGLLNILPQISNG